MSKTKGRNSGSEMIVRRFYTGFGFSQIQKSDLTRTGGRRHIPLFFLFNRFILMTKRGLKTIVLLPVGKKLIGFFMEGTRNRTQLLPLVHV